VEPRDAPPNPATVAKEVVIFALLSESPASGSSGCASFWVPILRILFYQMDSIELDWVWIAFASMPTLLNHISPRGVYQIKWGLH